LLTAIAKVDMIETVIVPVQVSQPTRLPVLNDTHALADALIEDAPLEKQVDLQD